ncbi:MAG: hypothetical protein HQ567_19010 [Candidatus Nealsonbacteria bacterium]|nr:hypothetical protein [Candidatus Nealsonbacteria bacterium]
MPSQPPSDKPGWRGQSQDGSRRKPVAGKKTPGWVGEKKADPHKSRVRRRNLQLAAYVVVLVALLGGYWWYITRTPQQTPLVTFAATNYVWPIPPNAWATEDVSRIAKIKKDRNAFKHTKLDQVSKEDLLKKLRTEELNLGGPSGDLVIIYLSMHGIVDGQNRPCLLLPGALEEAPDKWLPVPEKWLPVSELLNALKERKNVKTLLILDANRIDANWNMGVLYNGFAERLQDVVKKAIVEDRNLTVLNSCGPGQIGWAAPQFSGSVFGHFLWRGLRGEADGAEDGRENEEVSLQELIAYLQKEVKQWTVKNRDDVQVPMLLPADADYPLVFTQKLGPAKWEPTNISWAQVGQLWNRHKQLRNAYAYRVDPLKFEKFQHGLLELEQWTLAGNPGDRGLDLNKLAGELEQAVAHSDVAAHSLPMARRLRVAHADDVAVAREQLDAWLNSREDPAAGAENGTGDRPAESGADEGTPVETAAGEPDPPEPAEPANGGDTNGNGSGAPPPETNSKDASPPDYLDATEAAWNWARGEYADGREADESALPLERNRLDEALQFVDKTNSGKQPDLIELRFLRMLNAYLDPDTWQQNAEHVQRALQLRNKAEEAAAPKDERTHYWIQSAVEAADKKRRTAEDHLFVGDSESLGYAAQQWEAALGEKREEPSTPPHDTYHAAVENARKLADAFQTRDKVWARAPYLAQWLCGRLRERGSKTEEAALRDQLEELIRENCQLAAVLERSADDGVPAAADAARAIVEERLRVLDDVYAEECRVCAEDLGAHKGRCRRIASVLAVPLVTGERRRKLLGIFLTVENDEGEGASTGGPTDEDNDPEQALSPYLSRLVAWSEHPALTILKSVESFNSSLKPAVRNQPLERFAVQGWRVRQRLYGNNAELKPDDLPDGASAPKCVYTETDELLAETRGMLIEGTEATDQAEYSATKTRISCSRADQVVRVSAALLNHDLWTAGVADPTGQLRNLDHHHLMLWHARRAMEDFWGAEPGGKRPFFEIAAESYLTSAETLVDRIVRPAGGDSSPKRISSKAARDRLERLSPVARRLLTPTELQQLLADDQGKTLPHATAVELDAGAALLGNGLPGGKAAYYLHEKKSGPPIRIVGSAGLRIPIAIPGDSKERRPGEYEIANSDYFKSLISEGDSNSSAAMTARVYYRGHVGEQPCRFAAEALHVEYKLEDQDSTVRVSAGERDASVVFVFDSSGSMQDSVDGTELGIKMTGARNALGKMLRRLAASEKPPRVGLIVYGHRNGWNKDIFKKDGKLVPQHKSPPMSSDVQWILTPQPLTQKMKADVIAKLATLKPNGITPLYLSIIMAIKENRVAGEARHVIVITDGLNNQNGHTTDPDTIKINNVDVAVQQSLKDVIKAVDDSRMGDNRLDVVGFALDKPGEERPPSHLETTLKIHDRCSFRPAKATAILQEELEESLGIWNYEVRQRSGSFIQEGTINTAVLIPYGQHERQYDVRVKRKKTTVSKEVSVTGGEGLRLRLTQDGARLVFEPYAPDDGGESRTVGQFVVQAHDPTRAIDGIVDVSIRNAAAEQFSPRPKEVWIEIQPKSGGESNVDVGEIRTFYDSNYKRGEPVPRLMCEDLINWPTNATRAEVRVWFKPRETSPTKTKAVGELIHPANELPPFRIDDVEFKLQTSPLEATTGYRIEIKEMHRPENPLHWVKVEMRPRPDVVERRFYPKVGTACHSFTYKDAKESDVRGYEIRFTTEAAIKKDALKFGDSDSLQIDVRHR